jgi:hypothetical protein
MSELYKEIIKKRYQISVQNEHDISATDFVNILCSTTNINEDTKLILNQALNKIHSKRKEYIQYKMYFNYSEFLTPILQDFCISHNYNQNKIPEMLKFIWNLTNDDIKFKWKDYHYFGTNIDKKYDYPYLSHLYGLSKDEGYIIEWNSHICPFTCLISSNKCYRCKHNVHDVNMDIVISKLINNMKNSFDLDYISDIIIKFETVKKTLLLNNILCKKYLYNSIHLSNKNISNNIILIRLEIKKYMKVHDILRKRIKNNKIIKFIRLCSSNNFKKIFWDKKSIGGKWIKHKFISGN